MGRGVTALAEKDATLLMLCFEPQRNPLVPRGADVDDARRALPGWTLLDARAADPTTLPKCARAACAAVVQVRAQLTEHARVPG